MNNNNNNNNNNLPKNKYINNNNNNNYNNNNNNNNNNYNNTKILDNYYLYLNQSKYDSYNYLKFLFFDIKNINYNEIDDKYFQTKKQQIKYDLIIDDIVDDFKNKINDYSTESKNLYRNKSKKIMERIKNNYKNTLKILIIVKKNLKELEIKNNSPNIKFNKFNNLKLKNNIFFINNNFRYTAGELVARFLFLESKSEMINPTNPNFISTYVNSCKINFYKYISQYLVDNGINYNSNDNRSIKAIKELPQFYYFYQYFYIIGNLFNENVDFSNIFDKNSLENNLKKLYGYYKIGNKPPKNKKQDKKQDKKGKKNKKKKG